VLVVGCASQKGGVAKSSLARLLAREFAAAGRRVLLADLDVLQATSLEWSRRRVGAGLRPDIPVERCENTRQALERGRRVDAEYLVLDARGVADAQTLEVARAADVVFIPSGLAVDDLLPAVRLATASLDRPDAAAIAACLGDVRAHARMLHALTGADGEAARFAEVYLRHRPLADVDDVREVASDIATMRSPAAQSRALAVLAEARPSDPATLARLAEMYPTAATAEVQNAIAGLLLRGDDGSLDRVRLAQTLRQYRRNPAGRDLVDVLIRRLER